ncbi:MAG: 2-oxoglutarate dehydrogenase E1 component, partial [Rhodospirillales bacterium]
TPANYFHVLRRQMRRDFRKPLILMTPKSLLRHKGCVSALDEMAEGTTFHRVLWDSGEVLADDKIKKVVLCSGKVYYDIIEERAKSKQKDVYVLRVEQLFPFPQKALTEEIGRFKNAKEVAWCQEEPRNMGSWNYIFEPLERVLKKSPLSVRRPKYVGRSASASPATGSMKNHLIEQNALVVEALKVGKAKAKPKAGKNKR